MTTDIRPRIPESQLAARCSLVAAAILAVMCTIVAVTGTSQQAFESFAEPSAYAEALREGAATLRAIIFLDDLFITAYVASTVLFVHWLAAGQVNWILRVVLAATLTAGVLDLMENHHILAMLRASELGTSPSSVEISGQMVASSVKWLLGHIAFALIGLVVPSTTLPMRAFRFALIFVQLPVGALAWTSADPRLSTLLEWLRYGNVMIGFVVLAVLMGQDDRGRRADAASGSGALA